MPVSVCQSSGAIPPLFLLIISFIFIVIFSHFFFLKCAAVAATKCLTEATHERKTFIFGLRLERVRRIMVEMAQSRDSSVLQELGAAG